ncbi:MAG: hypothetical protein ACFFC7_04355 [Candidatus Hermodarchaeota archaeon]
MSTLFLLVLIKVVWDYYVEATGCRLYICLYPPSREEELRLPHPLLFSQFSAEYMLGVFNG